MIFIYCNRHVQVLFFCNSLCTVFTENSLFSLYSFLTCLIVNFSLPTEILPIFLSPLFSNFCVLLVFFALKTFPIVDKVLWVVLALILEILSYLTISFLVNFLLQFKIFILISAEILAMILVWLKQANVQPTKINLSKHFMHNLIR